MAMGRLLRESGFDALVPSSSVCQGTCVYLLAAGKRKTVRGYVGLHRPYYAHGDSLHSRSANGMDDSYHQGSPSNGDLPGRNGTAPQLGVLSNLSLQV